MEAEKLLDTHKNQTTYGANKTTLFMPNSNKQPVKSEAPDLLGELSPNQVQVYIWEPKGIGVGHISLRLGSVDKENKNIHISYFPATPVKNIAQKMEGMWVESLLKDINLEEKRQPEFTVILNQLDVKKMEKKFEELKKLPLKWHLYGSTTLKPDVTCYNCLSVAAEVLKAGGLERIAQMPILKLEQDIPQPNSSVGTIGILPYDQTEDDKCIKSCFSCCGKCCSCCFSLLAATSGILTLLFFTPFGFNGDLRALPLGVKVIAIIGLCVSTISLCILKCSQGSCLNSSNSRFITTLEETRFPLTPAALNIVSTNVGTIGQSVYEFPYDSARGIVHHATVFQGRIQTILLKAKVNEKKSYPESKEEKVESDTNEVRLAINQ